ncbi:glycerophosphodiester phosphodiesterase [Nesterenkonia xinjiangensis]|uniref:Glycerophosphoryl diester phosphodiesterase n=1 Tax=Nesterenkonia xinjiangensis TaxID=225327 RepID=A0A7Z0K922_9MICC|nr:glycerophosphoryl diester phosphodiesterase [Nesterenkonia xinjiangensis]
MRGENTDENLSREGPGAQGPAPRLARAQPVGRIPDPALHHLPADLDLMSGARRPRRAKVYAHRGSSGLFPEHTRAAYMRALDEGADGIEIDVHLTRDGEVICFHDPLVGRTTDGHGAVADLTLAQMRRLDVHSWKTPRLPGEYGRPAEQLMTFQELLELLADAGRDVGLAVELKHPSPYGHQLEEKVLQALLRSGWDPETSLMPGRATPPGNSEGRPGRVPQVDVSFMSFYPGSLQHLADMVPAEKLCALFDLVTAQQVTRRLQHLKLSFAVRPVVSAVMRGAARDAEALVWNSQVGLAGPGMHYVRERRADVKAWLARGLGLRVWTVDELDDVELLLALGVQEMTTNFPARVIAAVSAPGQEAGSVPSLVS